MQVLQLCAVAVITAVCALILKSQKSDLVPLCVTAGGILLILCGFDYLSESISFRCCFVTDFSILFSIPDTRLEHADFC